MATFPKQRFIEGLHTSPGDAGPDHCLEALNVYAREGRVVKRGGGVPLFVSSRDDGHTHGQGLGTAAGVRVVGGSITGDATDTYVYIKDSDAAFYWLSVTAHSIQPYVPAILESDIGCQYWNGAWTSVDRRFLPLTYFNTTTNEFISPPFVQADPGVTGSVAANVEVLNALIVPQTDWVSSTLSGSTGYWLRFGPYPAGALYGLVLKNVISTRGLPLWSKTILKWKDRTDAPHTLYAQFGESDNFPLFFLDGAQLTVDADFASIAGTLNAQTDIWCGYHDGSDQVIGRISGVGWFSIKTARGDGGVHPFVLDQTGENTPYQTVVEGLRSALPDGDAITFHDGRLWIADGERVFWSAPGPYVKIFPNGNFFELTDGIGNVTGFASFSASLAIFKRKSIWTAQPDGVTSEGYEASILPGNKGNVARNSVCVFGDYCLFIGEDGAYIFDSGRITKLSGNIDQLWLPEQKFAGDFSRAKLVFNGAINQARIFVPEPGEDSLLTRALYCSLDGMVEDSMQSGGASDKTSPGTWWPQGRYADGDHGFRAMCVGQDATTDGAATLLGDDRGIIWQMDADLYDGATPVKCLFRGSPVRVGDFSQMMVKGVAVTFQNTGDSDFSVWIVTDEDRRSDKTSSQSAYIIAAQAAELFDDTTLFDDTVLFKESRLFVQRKVPFSRRCVSLSVGAKHELAGAMEWLSFDVEAGQLGNWGSR